MDWQNENCRNILLAIGFVLFMLAVAISATAATEQASANPVGCGRRLIISDWH